MADEQTSQATGADLDAMQKQLKSIEANLDRMAQINNASRWQVVLVVVLLVIEMIVFLGASYQSVKTNFDPNRVQEAARQSVESVTPMLRANALGLMQEVGPVLQQQAMNELDQLVPELAAKLKEEAKKVPDDLHTDVTRQLEASLNRIAKRIKPDIQKTFPSLADEEKLDRMTEHFETRLYHEADTLKVELDDLYQRELAKLRTVLLKFEVEEKAKDQQVDLAREFAHNMLMMIDYELMNPDALDSTTRVILEQP